VINKRENHFLSLRGVSSGGTSGGASALHSDDPSGNFGLDALMFYLDALGLDELLQELLLVLCQLGNQVVDIAGVARVKLAELLVEDGELVCLLERCVQHVHSDVQIKLIKV